MGAVFSREKEASSQEKQVLEGHVQWLCSQQEKLKKEEEKEGSCLQVNPTVLEDAKMAFKEYKNEPRNAAKCLGAVAAHIALTNETTVAFENSITNVGTFQKLIKLLKDTGIADDAKYGEAVMTLIDLYHEEWSLLHETGVAMQSLKNKSKTTEALINFWKKKLEKGEKPSLQQAQTIENGIREWFEQEDSSVDLHKKWVDFHEKADKFREYFENHKLADILVAKLRRKCCDMKVVLAGAASVGLIAVKVLAIIGAVAISGAAATGIGAGVAVLMAVAIGGLIYYARQTYYDKKGANEELQEGINATKSMVDHLKQMVEFAAKIRAELSSLIKISGDVKGNQELAIQWKSLHLCGKDDYDEQDKRDYIEILNSISKSLNEFGEKCENIQKITEARQRQFARDQSDKKD